MESNQREIDQLLMDRLTSYELCCAENGDEPLTIEHFNHLPEYQRKSAYGIHRIMTWQRALNGKDADGKPIELNYNDGSRKWSPLFWLNDKEGDVPGAGFRLDDCLYAYDSSFLGARLDFREEYLFDHSFKHDEAAWRDMQKG